MHYNLPNVTPRDRKAGENELFPRSPTHPGPASGSPGVLQSQIAELEPRRMSASPLRCAPAWPAAPKRASPARTTPSAVRWIPTSKPPCFSPAFALRLVGFRPAFSLFFLRNPLKYNEMANFSADGAPFLSLASSHRPCPVSAGAPDRDGFGAPIFHNQKLHWRIHRYKSRHSRESGNPYSYPASCLRGDEEARDDGPRKVAGPRRIRRISSHAPTGRRGSRGRRRESIPRSARPAMSKYDFRGASGRRSGVLYWRLRGPLPNENTWPRGELRDGGPKCGRYSDRG